MGGASIQLESKETRLQRQKAQLQEQIEIARENNPKWVEQDGLELKDIGTREEKEDTLESRLALAAFWVPLTVVIYLILNGTLGWWNYDLDGRKYTAEEYKKANGRDKPNLPGSW